MASWCRITIVLEGDGAPDMAAIDELARWLLLAKRAGGRLTVDRVSPEMADLIDLSGLGVEMER
jgi:hypothetical protein